MKFKTRGHRPIALTIAGSDTGGGAGVQADLRTFTRLGVHGLSVLTCLTAQTPKGVAGVQAVTPRFLRLQLETVCAELPPGAAKTGMLFSGPLIREVIAWQRDFPALCLVVDPVMVATSGARLLKPSAIRLLCDGLLPRASLVTPNLDEAAVLLGWSVEHEEELEEAARQIHGRWGCPVLLKGGHLRGGRSAVDVFWDGTTSLRLSAPFVRGISTHGTGCTYSAAIAAGCAQGESLPKAVRAAKRYITRCIRNSVRIGKHWTLG